MLLPVWSEERKPTVFTVTIDHLDNNAWYRQVAAGWARRMMTGNQPATWAQNTDTEIQFAVSQLKLQRGDRVLDLGCGWGRHSLALAAYGLHVTGVDISRDLLAMARYNARRHNLDVNWVEADLAQLPLRGSFDAVAQFCGNLLTWFPDRERAVEVLWQVSRLLRPGGRLIFGTEDWESDLPERSQHWDEWSGGAAIYRSRYDGTLRQAETQTVIFGPQHARTEYRRQTWWPSAYDMETAFAEVGLRVCGCTNTWRRSPYHAGHPGLVYVLEREAYV